MQSRRDCLKAFGLATIAIASAEAVAAGDEPGAAWVNEALLGVRRGDRFARCTVSSVGELELGAIPVTMTGPQGESFRIDVLRHDGHTPGVARGGSLGVYMGNGGGGSLATHEEHGLAAMAFAAHLGRHEAAGASAPALLTLTERAERRQREPLDV